MIYDKLTKRDLYMYRRGEMREYIRNHGVLPAAIHRKLYEWIESGHSVHQNPWDLYDEKTHSSCDYLTALGLIRE